MVENINFAANIIDHDDPLADGNMAIGSANKYDTRNAS